MKAPTSKKSYVNDNIIVSRVSVTSDFTIQQISPLEGKKKLVYFGENLKNINIVVNSIKQKTFSSGDIIKLFSEEFIGDIEVVSNNTSKYSDLSYSIHNISAIGKPSAEKIDIKNEKSNNISQVLGLEDYNSISWQTTYIDGIGTGINVNKSSHDKEKVTTPSFSFKFNNKDFKLSNNNMLLVSLGNIYNRTYKGYTSTFVDPLSILLGKSLIISTIKETKLSDVTGNSKVRYLTEHDMLTTGRKYLMDGNISDFLTWLINEPSIKILNGTPSPMINALKENNNTTSNNSGDDGASYYSSQLNQRIDQVFRTGIYTISDVVAQILNFTGVELYYNYKSNTYTVDSPRIINFNENKANIEISNEDIVNISFQSNKAAMPSLLIPDIDFKNMTLSSAAQQCSELIASKLLSKLSEIKGLPFFKIQTFTIPEIFMPQSKRMDKKSIINLWKDNYFSNVWLYFASLSFKSIFSAMGSGSIQIVFNPNVTETHRWYYIHNEWYFVTNISHSLSRGNASTTLNFSAIYDKNIFEAINSLKDVSLESGCNNDKEINDTNTPFNSYNPVVVKKNDLTNEVKIEKKTTKTINSKKDLSAIMKK